jgi:hypothetical protein
MRLYGRRLFALLHLLLVAISKVQLDVKIIPDLVNARSARTNNVLDILAADIEFGCLSNCSASVSAPNREKRALTKLPSISSFLAFSTSCRIASIARVTSLLGPRTRIASSFSVLFPVVFASEPTLIDRIFSSPMMLWNDSLFRLCGVCGYCTHAFRVEPPFPMIAECHFLSTVISSDRTSAESAASLRRSASTWSRCFFFSGLEAP